MGIGMYVTLGVVVTLLTFGIVLAVMCFVLERWIEEKKRGKK